MRFISQDVCVCWCVYEHALVHVIRLSDMECIMSPKKGITNSPKTYGAFRSSVNKTIYRSAENKGKLAQDFPGGSPKHLRQAYKTGIRPMSFVKMLLAGDTDALSLIV